MTKTKKKKSIRERILKYKVGIVLICLFSLAVFLRTYNLSQSLFFGPEQGIDFFRIKSIAVDHRPVLVGAKTDIAGIFHGPIYYYISSVPFLLSHGDPVFIAYFLAIINSFTVFLMYFLGRKMFSRRVGFIAAILFTISFGAISYTHWLSSHPLVIPLSAVFLLSAYEFLTGKKRYLLLVSLAYALLGQAEFLDYIFFGGILIALIIVFFKDFKKQSLPFILFNCSVIFIFGFLHYVLFELRNHFIMTHSLLALFHGKGYYVSYASVISQIYAEWTEALSRNIFPFFPSVLALIILLVGIIVLIYSNYYIAKRLLLTRLFVPIIILIFLRHSILEQFFVYAIFSSLLVTAFLIDFLLKKNKLLGFLFFLIILFAQARAWYLYVPESRFMFFTSVQPDLHLRDEKSVIDEIYKRQHGKNFSFQAYTIPYWSQEAWEYLFWQYGKQKYGYEPVLVNGRTLYVIVQDDQSSKGFQDDWLHNTVSKWGVLKGTFRYGIFTVRVLDVPWVKGK